MTEQSTFGYADLHGPESIPVTHLLTTFLPTHTFNPVITRSFRPPKPDPAGILHIAAGWGLSPPKTAPAASTATNQPYGSDQGEQKGLATGNADDLIMVGDSVDDMTAGYRAGAATVLLVNESNAHLAVHEHTDLCIKR